MDLIKQERYRYGEEFLEKLMYCNGQAVIVKGKFHKDSREKNKLIFFTIRPFNEKIKTMLKVCNELVFPVDDLWKVRLLENASHGEQFYIVGHIKVVYENNRPKGTLVLATDVFIQPILTVAQFADNYESFRDKCYAWPQPGERKKEGLALIKRNLGVVAKPMEKVTRKTAEREGKTNVKNARITVLEDKTISDNNIDASSVSTKKIVLEKRQLHQQENKYARGRMLDESVISRTEESLDLFEQWQAEFNTTDKIVDFYGCHCELIKNIIFITNEVERWQIRYSPVYKRIILYHKNKKNIKNFWKKSAVEGYHEQFVPSIKEKPTIKEYIIYASLHKMMVEKSYEKQKRKQR